MILYTCIIVTQIQCCTRYYNFICISLLRRFTCMHALIVPLFQLHGLLFILHRLLLHGCSCILVIWRFFVTDIDIPITGHVRCWYVMCETKCHVDLSHRGRPHSCFSFSVILFHDINKAHALLSYWMYHVLFSLLIYCVV